MSTISAGSCTSRLAGAIGAPRPLVAVLHLPPSLGLPAFPGRDAALGLIREDVRTLTEGAVDAILLENDADVPCTLKVDKVRAVWLARAAEVARSATPLPLGIGVQRIDWEVSLAIAAAVGLQMVRLDVFVDRVCIGPEEVEVDPVAVLRSRALLGAEEVRLLTDVHVKHATLATATPIEESARRAALAGSAAVLVTGPRTGSPPSHADLRRARHGVELGGEPAAVLIGSGLDPSNASSLAACADGALVGTALKEGGRVCPGRVEAMVEAWRSACASRP